MAPLSGYTDLPFRNACRRHGCHYAFAPLVDSGSVIYHNSRNRKLLERGSDEPWLGVQLLGNDPRILAKAARILQSCDFDLFDLNLGCPVPKVVRRGAGAALAEQLEKARACASALVESCSQPVTAKIRILDDSDPEPTLALATALEACGITALTIHGRHRKNLYSGEVAAEIIRLAQTVLTIPVIANGGVMDSASATALRENSGCDLIMVARGAIGNPWIFREINNCYPYPPTHDEVCEEMERHVSEMVDFYGEDVGIRNARKIILAYLSGRGYRRCRRAAVTKVSTFAEFQELAKIIRQEGVSPKFQANATRF